MGFGGVGLDWAGLNLVDTLETVGAAAPVRGSPGGRSHATRVSLRPPLGFTKKIEKMKKKKHVVSSNVYKYSMRYQ